LTIDFVELFCGIGGFRLGLEKANSEMAQARDGKEGNVTNIKRSKSRKQSYNSRRFLQGKENKSLRGNSSKSAKGEARAKGFRCVWANDNDRSACKIYHHRFGYKELVEADIKTVKASSIPDHALLTAGFPCQAFSVAGKRKGFRDTRGTLFYEICRVAEAKRPPLLLLENVKGLLSHDEGLTFQIILKSLEELGYLCEWQVLNSKHFGVPQNRERVFIIGHLGGEGGRTVFPIGISNQISNRTNRKAQKEQERVSSTLHARYSSLQAQGETYLISNIYRGFKEGVRMFDDYSPTLRTPKGGGHLPVVVQSALIQSQGRESHIETRKDGVSHALKGKGGWEGNYLEIQAKEPYIQNIPHGFNEGWRKPFPNLRAEGDSAHNELLVQNYRIRRLTPVECERLQGFPDGWTRGVSDTQRYKLLGNAVTVNVIEFLGHKLLKRWF